MTKKPILERHYLFYLQLHYRAAVLFPHLDGGALQQEDCLRFSRRPRPGCAPFQRYFRVILGALWELEILCQEFHNQYGHKINTATRPYSFIEFDTYIQVVIPFWYGKGYGSRKLVYLLQKAKKTYSDSRGRRNLNNLNTELQDVQRIMVQVLSSLLAAVQSQDWAFSLQNIDDVLQRGAVLSEMENKSQNLTEMSRKYRFNCQSSRNCLLLERVSPQI